MSQCLVSRVALEGQKERKQHKQLLKTLLSILEIKPGAPRTLGKSYSNGLHPQLSFYYCFETGSHSVVGSDLEVIL